MGQGNSLNVELKNITIHNEFHKKDITDLVVEFNVFESIHTPMLTASMYVVDGAGILSKFPVIGQEKITAKLKRNEDEIDLEFYTSSIDNIDQINDTTISYIVNLVDRSYIKNSLNNISQSYSGTISDVIKSISENKLDTMLECDSTNYSYNIVVPHWTPYKTMIWLTNRAFDGNNCGFLLYNTLFNGMKFKSINNLYNQEEKAKIWRHKFKPNQTKSEINRGDIELYDEYMQTAFEFEMNELGNTTDNLYNGGLSSYNITVDLFNKKVDKFNFDYYSQFESMPKLGKIPSINNDFINTKINSKQNINYYSNDNVGKHTFIQKPFIDSSKNIMNTYSYRIGIPGRFWMSVGDLVDLTVNTNSPMDDKATIDDVVDKGRSGKYMITTMRHKINNNTEYTQFCDLCRGERNE